MKEILDSIIRVEQDLQKKSIEAEHEAEEILKNAKAKTKAMEDEAAEKFQKERERDERDLEGEVFTYEEEKKSEAHARLLEKEKRLENQKKNLIERMVKYILEEE